MSEITHLSKQECLLQPENYPWASDMEDTDFTSDKPSYDDGDHLGLFSDEFYDTGDPKIGTLRYYVYDPTKHGFPDDRSYPLIFALHGSGGSFVGKTAISWAGAEQLASPDRQKKIGGAYIIVPLANEVREGDNDETMTWMTPVEGKVFDGYTEEETAGFPYNDEIAQLLGHDSIYTEALFGLLGAECAKHNNIGKKIVFGTSAGGYGAWRMIISRPGVFDAALMMGGAYLPSRKELKLLSDTGTRIWICHARHDECVPFTITIEPILPALREMKNVELYLPFLSRRADGGIASNLYGMQMGQHCINDLISEDLLFLDGTPMDPLHPDGVTGWINSVVRG